MNLFYIILKHFFPKINITTGAFVLSEYVIQNTDFIDYSFINAYERLYMNYIDKNIDKKQLIKEKYKLLYDNIIDNIFIPIEKKKYLIAIFSRTQKFYFLLNRFAYKIKIKRFYQRKNIETDLFLNDLSLFKPEQIISLIENNVIYKFRITDLMRIIKSSIINSDEFYSVPNNIKNPYTNIKFSIANLYNIYYFIKNSSFIMPVLFHLFFFVNFDKKRLLSEYELIINEEIIKNFLKTSTRNIKCQYIHDMFLYYRNDISFKIDPSFPNSTLIKTFEPYLKHYIYASYSYNLNKRRNNKVKLKAKLKHFSKYNRLFGKKYKIKNSVYNNTNLLTIDKILSYIPSTANYYEKEGCYFVDTVLTQKKNVFYNFNKNIELYKNIVSKNIIDQSFAHHNENIIISNNNNNIRLSPIHSDNSNVELTHTQSSENTNETRVYNSTNYQTDTLSDDIEYIQNEINNMNDIDLMYNLLNINSNSNNNSSSSGEDNNSNNNSNNNSSSSGEDNNSEDNVEERDENQNLGNIEDDIDVEDYDTDENVLEMINEDSDSISSDMDIDEDYNNTTISSDYVYENEHSIYSYERQYELYTNHRNTYEINCIMNELITNVINNVTNENNNNNNIIMI